jgi:low temperature requirement protein LtrA
VGFWVPGLGRSSTSDWDIAPGHLAERCSAIVLIALGESITVTGAAFFELAWTPPVVAAFIGAFVAVVALWWIYFDTAADNTSRAFAAAADPGRLGRIAYTYLHALLVAGIVVVAVADDLVLQHPDAPASVAAILVTLGGPAIYLIGNAAFRRLLSPRLARSHVAGLVMLAALAPVATLMTALQLGLATGLVLAIVAALGSLLHRRQLSVRAGVSKCDIDMTPV